MAWLYGQSISKRDLLRRIGDISQVGGIRASELRDGNEKGVSALDVTTGSGFTFTVLPDRGLDISAAAYRGQSLCWRSSTGDVNPAFYDNRDIQWLRSFYGGLLTTCGMTFAGAPCTDQGEALGLHGRISNIPAKQVSWETTWEADEYVMRIRGKIRETRLFGEDLCMTRTITTRLGENRLWIHDEIENLGHQRTPLMMLYHINAGYPVVDADSELIAPVIKARTRDDEAKIEADRHCRFLPPTSGFKERVYYMEMAADGNGQVKAGLVNRSFNKGAGFGLYMAYPLKQLPLMIEWKMMGEGAYVVGMEPSNCEAGGRAQAREKNQLEFIEPGAVRTFDLEIGALTGMGEIDAFERTVRGIHT